MNLEELRKEYGEDIYAYRQEYAGAKTEKDGYIDEYVHFLEQKLTSDNSDYAKCKIEAEIKRLEENSEGDYITRISALEWALRIITYVV
jgi:hypothetical protein